MNDELCNCSFSIDDNSYKIIYFMYYWKHKVNVTPRIQTMQQFNTNFLKEMILYLKGTIKNELDMEHVDVKFDLVIL
jgi:hypothetical protein